MGLLTTTGPTQTHAAPTELGSSVGSRRGYKHGAPNGACPPAVPKNANTVQAESAALSRNSGLPELATRHANWRSLWSARYARAFHARDNRNRQTAPLGQWA